MCLQCCGTIWPSLHWLSSGRSKHKNVLHKDFSFLTLLITSCLHRGTDFRLQGVVLRRQLQSMADLLPPSLQEGYMESCESLVEDPDPLIAAQEIQTVFRDFLPPNMLPDGLVEACITCLQQYTQSKVQGSNPLARSGVFWVNMGLLQIKVWTPQTIFDPAVKRAYKLNYAQQEVSSFLFLVLFILLFFFHIKQ